MTLVEAVVWVGVFILAIGAITSTILFFYRANRYALEEAYAVASAQHGLDTAVEVIREASYSSQGAFPIVSIAPNDFVFYSDVEGNALTERVHFYLQGTNLMEGITDATGDPPDYTGAEKSFVIANYIRNTAQGVSMFRYYDQLGNEITNYSNWTSVRFVKVSLAVQVDVPSLPQQTTLYSSAAIRNLIGQ